jgi:hypothetical protein
MEIAGTKSLVGIRLVILIIWLAQQTDFLIAI